MPHYYWAKSLLANTLRILWEDLISSSWDTLGFKILLECVSSGYLWWEFASMLTFGFICGENCGCFRRPREEKNKTKNNLNHTHLGSAMQPHERIAVDICIMDGTTKWEKQKQSKEAWKHRTEREVHSGLCLVASLSDVYLPQTWLGGPSRRSRTHMCWHYTTYLDKSWSRCPSNSWDKHGPDGSSEHFRVHFNSCQLLVKAVLSATGNFVQITEN